MNRQKKLDEVKKKYVLEYVDYAVKDIIEDLQVNGYEYLKQCLWDFDVLFKKAYEEQIEGKKGTIHYIAIFFLHSAIQSKTYDLQIELYDENYYLDKNPIVNTTSSFILKKYYENNWNHFSDFMYRNMIQLKRQELLSFRKDLNYKYKKLICECIKSQLPFIMRLKSYEMLEKDEEVNILFGEYYTELVKLN